jgi:hypothetical protein
MMCSVLKSSYIVTIKYTSLELRVFWFRRCWSFRVNLLFGSRTTITIKCIFKLLAVSIPHDMFLSDWSFEALLGYRPVSVMATHLASWHFECGLRIREHFSRGERRSHGKHFVTSVETEQESKFWACFCSGSQCYRKPMRLIQGHCWNTL